MPSSNACEKPPDRSERRDWRRLTLKTSRLYLSESLSPNSVGLLPFARSCAYHTCGNEPKFRLAASCAVENTVRLNVALPPIRRMHFERSYRLESFFKNFFKEFQYKRP